MIKTKEISGEERALNWGDTKKMPITTRVIQETLRAASILSFTFREAVEDVEFNGELKRKNYCLKRFDFEIRSINWKFKQGIRFQKDGKCCHYSEIFTTAQIISQSLRNLILQDLRYIYNLLL